jgi:hypothetical protein
MLMRSPDEVSIRWAARKLGMHYQSLHRWCRTRCLEHVRPEYGGKLPNGEPVIKRYWLNRAEIETMAAINEDPHGSGV